MKAIGKYIIIKKIEEQVTTKGGLLLSKEDVSGFRYQKGEVIKPGTDVEVIKAKDVIYYDKGSGNTVMINKEQYTIILEKNVVIVV